jgi:phage protein D
MKGGIDITNHFNDRTTEIKVELVSGGGNGDQCTIKIDDRDWRIARPYPGETLSIWLGYQEVGLAFMGVFHINEVTFLGMPRSIQLLGLSTTKRDFQKAPQIAEFDNKSVGDILTQLAGQTGLGVAIDGSLAGQKIPFKNQTVSNLHMIHELERIYGAVAKVQDGKLLFVPRDGTKSASGMDMPTLVLLPEHFGNWQVRYSANTSYGSVKASWWDKNLHVRKWVNQAIKKGDQLGGGAFGGAFPMAGQFNSEAEAIAAATSKGEALERGTCQATFDLAKGDPWIRDRQTLLVSGMRDGIDGSYVIQRAIHTYVKSSGIKSSLECMSPGNGANFGDRADEEFLKPAPGELMGEVLKDGSVVYMPNQDQPL